MIFNFRRFPSQLLTARQPGRHRVACCLLSLVAFLSCLWLIGTPSALAGLNDDKFDGNIFALYAGNGSLVPARVTLTESLRRERPSLLVFYLDDSSDCKQYAAVISQLQDPYGRAANFLPINIDSLPPQSKYQPTEPGYYYQGLVPQTVILDQKGKVVLNVTGQVPYEQVDDAFRKVFDLLPRSESVELKRRTFNEFNTELVEGER